ncbi:MAG: 2-amino-4-hydroxy-6-hydroxymethyldihydropteridine diphosphokinase, partial [Planctomycetota bacterium]
MADCLIGLGSNLGDRVAQLDQAIHRFCGSSDVTLREVSRYHETPAVGGPPGQARFLNAVMRITTDLPPLQLLARAQQVEGELGRRRWEHWGPRSIDIDVLLYDLLVMTTEELVVPHPWMAVRRFVLEPACEVGADLIHPPTGWTVAQLRTRLDQPPCYIAICCADEYWINHLIAAATHHMDATVFHGHRGFTAPPPAAGGHGVAPRLETELAWLTARRNILGSIQTEGGQERVYLSDFWLNQSLAVARTWPPGRERVALHRACQAAIEQCPQPRFVLHLDCTAALATDQRAARYPRHPLPSPAPKNAPDSTRIVRHQQRGESRTPVLLPAVESLAQQLRCQLARTGQSPVLRVRATDTNAALVTL